MLHVRLIPMMKHSRKSRIVRGLLFLNLLPTKVLFKYVVKFPVSNFSGFQRAASHLMMRL